MAKSGSQGWKADDEKDRWDLVPTDALRGIVKVLTFGAKKYDERNWEQGFEWSRAYGALLRHLTAWWEGEPCDPETGYSHLWHAGCCILFLIAFEMRGIGKDNRHRVVEFPDPDELEEWEYDPRHDSPDWFQDGAGEWHHINEMRDEPPPIHCHPFSKTDNTGEDHRYVEPQPLTVSKSLSGFRRHGYVEPPCDVE